MNEQRIYRAALAAWGADAQTLMVFEEMAELQRNCVRPPEGGTTGNRSRKKLRTWKSCWNK